MTPQWRAVLAATDLDLLASAVDALGDPSGRELRAVDALLDAGAEPQAVVNLLLHPRLLPPHRRVQLLLEALEDDGYERLAATAGAAQLRPEELDVVDRVVLVGALLGVASGASGVVAQQAARALRVLAAPPDTDDLVELLTSQDPVVRATLTAAVLELVGPQGLRAALDHAGPAGEVARTRLAADGVDLASDVPPPPPATLTRLPDRRQWSAEARPAAP